MKLKKTIFLILISIATSCKQDNSEIFINSINKDKENLSYYIINKEKPFFETDTLIYKYNVSLKKNELDTIYGYDLSIINDDFIFYHNNNISYNFYSKNKTYVSNNKGNKNYVNYVMPLNKIMKKDFLDSLNILSENEKHLVFIKKYKNEQGFSEIKEKFIISKKTKNLISNTLKVDFQNTDQHSEIAYKNIKFDVKTDITREIDSLKTIYKPLTKPKKNIKKLDVDSINAISGTLIKSGAEKKLSNFKQDFLLIDFWYMSCHPCIKSFPTLINLKNDYRNRSFEIIGINTLDNTPKNKKQLNNFILNNSINYPTLLSFKSINYLNAYPTVLILNKKREIIYSHTGYSIENEESLIEFLDNLFN